jgi:hypothetical protein
MRRPAAQLKKRGFTPVQPAPVPSAVCGWLVQSFQFTQA